MKDRVICWHSGYKGEEYPLSFLHRNKKKESRKLIQIKLIEDSETAERETEFIVETETGEKYRITVGKQTTITRIRVKKA